jgi:hypothetical protein
MTCYVCGGTVKARSLQDQMAAQRALNKPVEIGGGLVRHSRCEPGKGPWMRAMAAKGRLSKRDREWVRRFTDPQTGRPYAEIVRKAPPEPQDEP